MMLEMLNGVLYECTMEPKNEMLQGDNKSHDALSMRASTFLGRGSLVQPLLVLISYAIENNNLK